MTRYLFVGDPHATPDDLNDARALCGLVLRTAVEHKATVILAGDLYHTHAIIHADVQLLWFDFFEACRIKGVEVVVIKGNHDAPGVEGSRATALLAHYHQVATVLYQPFAYHNVLFAPYTNGLQLVKWSAEHPECGTLVCHQTFDGSVYENGFFAGDGVDPAAILQKRIISGHIHAPQEFFKVWYPGAPRWRTLGDANVERAIWLLEFDGLGNLMTKTPIDTGPVCRRIYAVVDSASAKDPLLPKHLPRKEADVYHVEIRGPQAWLDQRRPFWDSWGARVRTVRTDGRADVKVRESEGVGVAFDKYTDVFVARHGTERDVLKKMAKSRINGF